MWCMRVSANARAIAEILVHVFAKVSATNTLSCTNYQLHVLQVLCNCVAVYPIYWMAVRHW